MSSNYIHTQFPRIWWLLAAVSSSLFAAADTVPDKVVTLDSLTVAAQAPTKMRVDTDGNLTLDGRYLKEGLRVGSELDLTRILLSLPGIFASSDYASAVSVDGGDPGHNLYTVAGAKVYYPYHFGGIFSTFNNDHYPQLQLHRLSGDDTGCIGANLQFNPLPTMPPHTKVYANIGMLSSGATISQPITPKLGFTASARASYINLLYDKWLNERDGSTTLYRFQDYGFTAYYHPTDSDRILCNGILSSDRFSNTEPDRSERRMRWQNAAASLQWQHSGSIPMLHTLYYSHLNTLLTYDIAPFIGDVRSRISTIGAHGTLHLLQDPDLPYTLDAGYDISYDRLRPLDVSIAVNNDRTPGAQIKSRTVSSFVWTSSDIAVSDVLTVSPRINVAANAYSDGIKPYINPQLSAEWRHQNHTLHINGGMYTQFLHLASITDIGMPSNFWLPSDRNMKAERALSAMATYTVSRPIQLPLTASVSLVGKRLYDCIQFDGNLMNLMNDSYRLYDHIAVGRGWSGGIELTVRKSAGRLNGWASYTWMHSRRLFSDAEGWVRAAGVPAHTASLTAAYNLSSHWVLSANFAYNSGRPYTPIEAIYMINENIVMEYGKHNSASLPAYHHLDLGLTYKFASGTSERLKHSLNLSIFNIYGHKNIEFISYQYDKDKYRFYRRTQESMLRFLPSLSYSLEF